MRSSKRKTRKARRSRSKRYGGTVMNITQMETLNEEVARLNEQISQGRLTPEEIREIQTRIRSITWTLNRITGFMGTP